MNLTQTTQREYKDRLFKAICGRDTEESKLWRLELYNALNNTSYTNPDALELNTIENIIYITMKNDISFLIDDQMMLLEQQSTHNPNMPLRGFLYFAQLYNGYLKSSRKDPNRCSKIGIPTPKFIVLYNGSTDKPNEFTMRLSESFINPDTSGAYEWSAYVKNINTNHNEGLQKKCKSLYDYSRFVTKVRENTKGGMEVKDAVNDAVSMAIKENLLDGFFERQKAEVIEMILTEFDEEVFKQNVREDGYIDGLSQGISQKAVEAAVTLIQKYNATPEDAARDMNAPLEAVLEKLKKELTSINS